MAKCTLVRDHVAARSDEPAGVEVTQVVKGELLQSNLGSDIAPLVAGAVAVEQGVAGLERPAFVSVGADLLDARCEALGEALPDGYVALTSGLGYDNFVPVSDLPRTWRLTLRR